MDIKLLLVKLVDKNQSLKFLFLIVNKTQKNIFFLAIKLNF